MVPSDASDNGQRHGRRHAGPHANVWSNDNPTGHVAARQPIRHDCPSRPRQVRAENDNIIRGRTRLMALVRHTDAA